VLEKASSTLNVVDWRKQQNIGSDWIAIAVFSTIEVSKSFGFPLLRDWLHKVAHFFIQSELRVKPNPFVNRSHVFFRLASATYLVGTLDSLRLVIMIVLHGFAVHNSIELRL